MAKKKVPVQVLSKETEKIQNRSQGKKSTNVLLSSCYKQSQDLSFSTKKWLKFCKSVKGLSREVLVKKCVDAGFTV